VAITVLTSAASDWTLGVEICPAMPVTGCRVPASTKGLLKISENADPAKNKLEWKWSKGAATTKAEFGDPTSTEDYTLCIYDAGALVSSTRIEAGGVCAGKNCWKENSKGYQFKDEELTPDGARQLQLKEGIAGVAQIQLKGRGANLELPPVLTSLTGPIEVQLTQARGAACWGATFSAPFTKQDAVNLLGKSD